MLVAFLTIFVAGTKLIYSSNFVAPLKARLGLRQFLTTETPLKIMK